MYKWNVGGFFVKQSESELKYYRTALTDPVPLFQPPARVSECYNGHAQAPLNYCSSVFEL